MKLAIASAAVASALTLGAFSPLALGQQLSKDSLRPQVVRTFEEQAEAARAKLRPQTAGQQAVAPDAAADRKSSAAIMASDPLLQLNAAYYNQSRELAKIAPKLPPDLRAEVERDIQALQAKRQALLKIRQRNMARQSTTRPDLAGRPTARQNAASNAVLGPIPGQPNGQRLGTPRVSPNRGGVATAKNPPRREFGSARGPAGQRANLKRQAPPQRRRAPAGVVPTAQQPTATPQ